MKAIYQLIKRMEELDNANAALQRVAEALTQIGLEQMNSSMSSFEVIEGGQTLWTALMAMRRLADKDPSARAVFFLIYRKMRDSFAAAKGFPSDNLDHLLVEAEHFVDESDASLLLDEQTHQAVMHLLSRKHLHQKPMMSACNEASPNQHN